MFVEWYSASIGTWGCFGFGYGIWKVERVHTNVMCMFCFFLLQIPNQLSTPYLRKNNPYLWEGFLYLFYRSSTMLSIAQWRDVVLVLNVYFALPFSASVSCRVSNKFDSSVLINGYTTPSLHFNEQMISGYVLLLLQFQAGLKKRSRTVVWVKFRVQTTTKKRSIELKVSTHSYLPPW